MKVNRRDCLRAGALAGAAGLAGCSNVIRRYSSPATPESVALPTADTDPTARLVNRVSYGPTPNELHRVATLGRERYAEEQLHPDGHEPAGLHWRLHGLDVLHKSAFDLMDSPESQVIGQLQQATLLWAVYSPFQLRERMVDFWTNHLNIYSRKGHEAYLKPVDEVRVIRRHALGKFPDMLKESAKSPAMLSYLDNQVNHKGQPNENYARELMELHTLGVHGGYTQKDVMEVARCLTGWTLEERPFWQSHAIRPRWGFYFDAARHDEGEKIVLGHRISPGGGEKDGDQVLDILTRHPATARFISTKICRHFLGEETGQWPDRLAKIYLETSGDIPSMLRPLLLSDELLEGPPIIKRPFDFVVSALRALNANTDGGVGVRQHLDSMGQALYQWPMPDGYPVRTAAWTGSLLGRWNFAAALCSGSIRGTTLDLPGLVKASGAETDSECADSITGLVLARSAESNETKPLAGAIREHIARSPRTGGANRAVVAQATALALASPEFQWR